MSEAMALAEYLQSIGWTAGAGDENLREWVSAAGHAVLIPGQPDFVDYQKILSRTIAQLEPVLGVTSDFLWALLSLPGTDVVDIHAFPSVDRAAYSFDAVLELLDSTMASFRTAARSLDNPALSHTGGSLRAEASEYLSGLRIGFSQPGSYSFPVFAPLGLDGVKVDQDAEPDEFGEQQEIETEVETYERRVTLRMLDSVRETVGRAEAASNQGLEVFDDSYLDGVSSNLCENVNEMFVDGYFSAIELRPRLSARISSQPRNVVRLEADKAPILREAAERMKSLAKETVAMTVTGFVVDLHRSTPGTDETVSVTTLIDGKRRTIKIGLAAAAYSQAIRAHDENRQIIAQGRLKRRGSRSWLEDIKSFRIIGNETLFGDE